MKEKIQIDGREVHTADVMNPPGMFVNGQRQREYSTKDMLPMSGKLIPEFDGRRNIRDMFTRKPSLSKSQSTASPYPNNTLSSDKPDIALAPSAADSSQADIPDSGAPNGQLTMNNAPSSTSKKRSLADSSTNKSLKRSKSGSSAPALSAIGKGQQSLKGFFQATTTARATPAAPSAATIADGQHENTADPASQSAVDMGLRNPKSSEQRSIGGSFTSTSPASSFTEGIIGSTGTQSVEASPSKQGGAPQDADTVHDPVQSKESWSKLFTKPAAPRCEGHDEPCKTMLTKKSGMNCGRSFWMCARPLGPSGEKEKNTQWRCHAFIWCSDWNPSSTA